MIDVGPTGKLIKGSLFDANVYRVKRALRDWDKQIHLEWNPRLRDGYGGWEIHWVPEMELPQYQGKLDGEPLYAWRKIRPSKNTVIKFDIPYLHDNLVGELQKRDLWQFKAGNKQVADGLEKFQDDLQTQREQEAEYKSAQARKEYMRENKAIIKDYYEYCRSGYNPLWFLGKNGQK